MFEQPPAPQESKEGERVTKEAVLEAYSKTLNGQEDGPTKDLLIKWTEQQRAVIETIPHGEEYDHALALFEYEKVELYADTGFDEIALEELEGDGVQEGLIFLAEHRGEWELSDKMVALAERIRERIINTGETLAPNNIPVPDLELLSKEELKKQEEEATSKQIYELSAQIRDMLTKK